MYDGVFIFTAVFQMNLGYLVTTQLSSSAFSGTEPLVISGTGFSTDLMSFMSPNQQHQHAEWNTKH